MTSPAELAIEEASAQPDHLSTLTRARTLPAVAPHVLVMRITVHLVVVESKFARDWYASGDSRAPSCGVNRCLDLQPRIVAVPEVLGVAATSPQRLRSMVAWRLKSPPETLTKEHSMNTWIRSRSAHAAIAASFAALAACGGVQSDPEPTDAASLEATTETEAALYIGTPPRSNRAGAPLSTLVAGSHPDLNGVQGQQ